MLINVFAVLHDLLTVLRDWTIWTPLILHRAIPEKRTKWVGELREMQFLAFVNAFVN